MTLRTRLIGFLLVPLSTACCAQAVRDATDGELALLPPFCYDTMNMRYGDASHNRSPRASHWESLMGQSFWAMHHFCWAKINQRRIFAPGTDPKFRIVQLTGVINDYGYVIKNSPPDFVMLPEIYSSLGEIELLRKNPVAAGAHFYTARKLKPSYPPPYQMWSEYLISIGQKEAAKTLLKTGLEHNSTAMGLQALYRKLGGDPRAIVPVSPSTAAASQPNADIVAAPTPAAARPATSSSSPSSSDQ